MTDIPIYCAFDEMVPIEDLKPNPRNPNQHPEKQLELIAKIIKNQGWRMPITISTRSGFIVRGHGRYEAAKKLGLTVVPVDKQDYENDAAELADLIADNRLPELAIIDKNILKDLLIEIDISNFSNELTAFDDQQIDAIIGMEDPAAELAEQIKHEKEVDIATGTVDDTLKIITRRLEDLARQAPQKLNKAHGVVVPLKKGSRELFVLADPNTRDAIAELKRYSDAGEDSPLACLLEGVHTMRKSEDNA